MLNNVAFPHYPCPFAHGTLKRFLRFEVQKLHLAEQVDPTTVQVLSPTPSRGRTPFVHDDPCTLLHSIRHAPALLDPVKIRTVSFH